MSDVVDYTEVPYLQEILNYLPIDPADEEDVINYIQNITNLIAVNYPDNIAVKLRIYADELHLCRL